jgi:hypothetical protein
MKRSEVESDRSDRDQVGLCDEAQADGVPCWELGRQCETCERARPKPAEPPLTAQPPVQRKPRPRKR